MFSMLEDIRRYFHGIGELQDLFLRNILLYSVVGRRQNYFHLLNQYSSSHISLYAIIENLGIPSICSYQ